MSRFPGAFRPPAFASWASLSRQGKLGHSYVRLTKPSTLGLDPDGVSTFHMREMRPGLGAPSTPRPAVLTRPTMSLGRRLPPPPAARPSTPVPHPSIRGFMSRGINRGFSRHPSGLPLARDPRMTRRPLRLPSGLRTPPLPAKPAKGRDRHQALAWNYALGINRASNLRVHSQQATSCRTSSA